MFATQVLRLFFLLQSHSENPIMPHEEKQSLHTHDQEEMSAVKEEIKEGRSIVFIPLQFSQSNQIIPGTISCCRNSVTLFKCNHRKLC